MNFLAHLHLAEDHPAALVGSILPDLARGRGPIAGPPQLLAAVAQHRKIDAFTDTHPIVAQSKARLRAKHGIYSGILVDIFYDHFLAADFPRYSPTPLPAFVARVHAAFATHRHLMPEAMRYPIDRLIEQDWLGSYATTEGIELALRRLSHRLSERFNRPVRLETAVADLIAHRDALAADFHAFFPKLTANAQQSGDSSAVGLSSSSEHQSKSV